MIRVIIVLLVIFSSCTKKNNNIVDDSMFYASPVWEKVFKKKSDKWLPGTAGNIHLSNGLALLTFVENEKYVAKAINPNTGEVAWSFDNWFLEGESLKIDNIVEEGGVCHWMLGTRNYWLDINTGKEVKRYRQTNSMRGEFMTMDGLLYRLGAPRDTLSEYESNFIFSGDFYTSPMNRFLIPPFDTSGIKWANPLYGFTGFVPLKENGKKYIVGVYSRGFSPGKIVNFEIVSYLGLYDIEDQKWVYKDVKLNEMHWKGVVYKGLHKYNRTVIGNIHNNIICYDYMTGEKVWEREFPHDFSFAGLEISDDVLIGSCENKVMYGVDPATGDILWRSEGLGGGSTLKYRVLNGVLYYSGGQYLRALDIKTGQLLWKIDSERYEGLDGYWSVFNLFVVPGRDGEKGKVIARNKSKYFCFDAIR